MKRVAILAAVGLSVLSHGPAAAQQVGSPVAGMPNAVWADNNNDGNVDGYVYNGQYYAGGPAVAASAAPAQAAPAPVSARVAAPVDAVSNLPLPLYPGETLVPFRNGCAAVATGPMDRKTWSGFRWWGSCRFGLADGNGYVAARTEHSKYAYHLGYQDRSDGEVRAPARADGVEESVIAQQYLEPNSGDGSDSIFDHHRHTAAHIVARRQVTGNGRVNDDFLIIGRRTCPDVYTRQQVKDTLPYQRLFGKPYTPEQMALILAVCSRAAAEAMQGVHTFDATWFLVALRHEEDWLGPDGSVGPNMTPDDQQFTNVTICPSPADIKSCEPIWRSLEQPFLKRRAELEALWKAHMQDRAARFAPLEAARRAKIAALRAAPAEEKIAPVADSQASQPPPQTTVSKKAKAGAPASRRKHP